MLVDRSSGSIAETRDRDHPGDAGHRQKDR